jgi:hypothetical protein
MEIFLPFTVVAASARAAAGFCACGVGVALDAGDPVFCACEAHAQQSNNSNGKSVRVFILNPP